VGVVVPRPPELGVWARLLRMMMVTSTRVRCASSTTTTTTGRRSNAAKVRRRRRERREARCVDGVMDDDDYHVVWVTDHPPRMMGDRGRTTRPDPTRTVRCGRRRDGEIGPRLRYGSRRNAEEIGARTREWLAVRDGRVHPPRERAAARYLVLSSIWPVIRASLGGG